MSLSGTATISMKLPDALEKARNADHPIVIHMCTVKGKGYLPAELDPENWHGVGPFEIASGKPLYQSSEVETYENLTRDYLAGEDEKRSDSHCRHCRNAENIGI